MAAATRARNESLRALAPAGDPELQQQAFLACLLAGRAGGRAACRASCRTIRWRSFCSADAEVQGRPLGGGREQRFAALPRQGLTQLLQPLLVAWAQQGAGHTDAALATLRPFIEGSGSAASMRCTPR